MGVPKFYRWISERYPCLSEVVQDHQVPEFDNLYLDMNGIIHACSHPNDEDPTFRITQEQIFKDIFRYIDTLFRIIRPRRTFFMAVDGVAPRAKMNQQRARRFMSARNAEQLQKEAISNGQTMPDEDRFDSNCITPGTEFMVSLHSQLQYFVNERITNDENWRNIRVVLSGHNCPGEGEHKIMDFIRHERSQPGYDANTRHCLYGLDADLLMLGMCSHEPHFSLLREEVKFLRPGADKQKSKTMNPEQVTFHLLHLSLLREYLELEFLPVKEKLPFAWDMESIIDDWVMMGFLVGNDFIPNLPHMHIHDGALPTLYRAYMDALPSLGGYINERGDLNLPRFEKFLAKLSQNDKTSFTANQEDQDWLESKRGGNEDLYGVPEDSPAELVPYEDDNFDSTLDDDEDEEGGPAGRTARNRSLHLPREKRPAFDTSSEEEEEDEETKTSDNDRSSSSSSPLLTAAEALSRGLIGGNTKADSSSTKAEAKVDTAPAAGTSAHMDNIDSCMGFYNSDDDEDENGGGVLYAWSAGMNRRFKEHKRNYYKEKMHYRNITKEELRDQAIGYVKAIQWNLHYYYHGCCSWSWFYPHHYAPYLSDIKDFSDLQLEFDLSEPFLPFQQLMGVLPAASGTMLPKPYLELMVSTESSVFDFYPTDFTTDLNGKKNDWEAVVLIKFIDEKRLLSALASMDHRLTADERRRNVHGPHLEFTTVPHDDAATTHVTYPSSLPGVFPDIPRTLARCREIPKTAFHISRERIVKGLLPGVKMNVYFTGFPTMKHLEYTGALAKSDVKVFQAVTRNKSMMLYVEKRDAYTTHNDPKKAHAVASRVLAKEVHVEWPFLVLAQVVSLATRTHVYEWDARSRRVLVKANSDAQRREWVKEMNNCRDFNAIRRGIVLPSGDDDEDAREPDDNVLVYVRKLIGRRIVSTNVGELRVEKQWSQTNTAIPLDLLVEGVLEAESTAMSDSRTMTFQEAFPFDCHVFLLLQPALHADKYGCLARVKCTEIGRTGEKAGLVVVEADARLEPDLQAVRGSVSGLGLRWYTGQELGRRLGVSSFVLSRITGTVFLLEAKQNTSRDRNNGARDLKINIGLNLKSSKKMLEVPDYTKRVDEVWLYSSKVGEVLMDYGKKFPEVFDYMLEVSGGDDVYYADDIWADDDVDVKKKVKQIKDFHKALACTSVERQSFGSECADERVVATLERIVDEMQTQQPTFKTKRLAVKIAYLYRPRLNRGNTKPDADATFELLDRVVSVKDGTAVPLALRGTVIGIHPGKLDGDRKLDVMFDSQFLGATKMRCSTKRCYRVPAFAVINLTHADRCAAREPDAQQRKLRHSQQPLCLTQRYRSHTRLPFGDESGATRRNGRDNTFASIAPPSASSSSNRWSNEGGGIMTRWNNGGGAAGGMKSRSGEVPTDNWRSPASRHQQPSADASWRVPNAASGGAAKVESDAGSAFGRPPAHILPPAQQQTKKVDQLFAAAQYAPQTQQQNYPAVRANQHYDVFRPGPARPMVSDTDANWRNSGPPNQHRRPTTDDPRRSIAAAIVPQPSYIPAAYIAQDIPAAYIPQDIPAAYIPQDIPSAYIPQETAAPLSEEGGGKSIMNEILNAFGRPTAENSQSNEELIAYSLKSQLNIGQQPMTQAAAPPQHGIGFDDSDRQQYPLQNIQPSLPLDQHQQHQQQASGPLNFTNRPPQLAQTPFAWTQQQQQLHYQQQMHMQQQQLQMHLQHQQMQMHAGYPDTFRHMPQQQQHQRQYADGYNRQQQQHYQGDWRQRQPPPPGRQQQQREKTSDQSHAMFVPLQVTKKQETPAYARPAGSASSGKKDVKSASGYGVPPSASTATATSGTTASANTTTVTNYRAKETGAGGATSSPQAGRKTTGAKKKKRIAINFEGAPPAEN